MNDEMQSRFNEMILAERVKEHLATKRAEYLRRVAFMGNQPRCPEARLHLKSIHRSIMDRVL